jgi:hypothetical protein
MSLSSSSLFFHLEVYNMPRSRNHPCCDTAPCPRSRRAPQASLHGGSLARRAKVVIDMLGREAYAGRLVVSSGSGN